MLPHGMEISPESIMLSAEPLLHHCINLALLLKVKFPFTFHTHNTAKLKWLSFLSYFNVYHPYVWCLYHMQNLNGLSIIFYHLQSMHMMFITVTWTTTQCGACSCSPWMEELSSGLCYNSLDKLGACGMRNNRISNLYIALQDAICIVLRVTSIIFLS